jgi:type II secretory ATPase GspE/PulE/Tfp pilus assembly ATPase PilB-like protein
MPNLLAADVHYGGYISLVKFIVMVAMYFAWMPLVNWVHADTQAVRTRTLFWTAIISTTGAVALIVWLLVPMFIIGFLLYVIAVGAPSLAYVMHRNSKVADFEKVLTTEHIKSIFVNEDKKITKASRGLTFITANKNEVPLPKSKTPEALGFQAACELFDDAIWRRASEILFQPGTQDYNIVYSVDGEAMKQPPRTKEQMDHFIHYLKMLADLDTNEKRKPQKGNFKVTKDDKNFSWEVVTAGSTAGEQLKLTRLEQYHLMTLKDIGLNPGQLEPLQSLTELESGLVIISGPKQSGITTTLYALLRNHDPFMNNINTLEKQPSAELPNITQHIFTLSDTGSTTYPQKLQAVLRMGPEIIGIADCEEAQSASLACQASKDGKTVYATIEATSVIQALGKWLKLVADKDLVTETLTVIINQRLVRKLCTECRQAYQPNQGLFRKFNIPSDKIKVLYRPGEIEYDKHGKPIVCNNCQGTGFTDRTGIFETIVINDELRQVIRNAKSLQEVASHFRRAGMLYLQEQSIKKVSEGITSINEVIRKFSSATK